MKKNTILLFALLLCTVAFCACKKNKYVDNSHLLEKNPPNSFEISYVDALDEAKVVLTESKPYSAKDTFTRGKFMLAGEITKLREVKIDYTIDGESGTDYYTSADFAVNENLGSEEPYYSHGNVITIVYPSCSHNKYSSYAELAENMHYILILTDTEIDSRYEGLEKYGRYSVVYPESTVISRSGKGYDATDFMKLIMDKSEEDIKDSYSSKEIKKICSSYLKCLQGFTEAETQEVNENYN